ncbi:MAG: hypothetical protein QMD65_03690 [Patescibacteria group bacterium]|nr:hypothetical protein [Patescibacteria group bacterium]
MNENNGLVYITIVIFALLVLSGFYLIFDKISAVKSDVKNLELKLELLSKEKKESPLIVQNEPTKNTENIPTTPTNQNQTTTVIPTAIIFDASSSPILQPQTKITITIENISKTEDGTVKVNFKAFTNEATSYSALEPRDLFQLLNLEGDNQKPFDVTGQFNSIPPKNAVAGSVIFKILPTQNSIILQTGFNENIRFYEFNFLRKTYKETVIG